MIAVQACDQDVEVLVSDNALDDETEEVCAQSDIAGLKYFRQPDRLSMRQNFEVGLSRQHRQPRCLHGRR